MRKSSTSDPLAHGFQAFPRFRILFFRRANFDEPQVSSHQFLFCAPSLLSSHVVFTLSLLSASALNKKESNLLHLSKLSLFRLSFSRNGYVAIYLLSKSSENKLL